MLENYLKITWKMLLRRKFFTFINLFGISFTLMILTMLFLYIDFQVGSRPPETALDRTLFISRISLYKNENRTERQPSYYFLDRYVRTLRTPENISFYSSDYFSVRINDKSKILSLQYVDRPFWDILDFTFIEGRPFTADEVEKAMNIAVINASTRKMLWGSETAVGKLITIKEKKYRVIGVVENVSVWSYAGADAWVPLTTDDRDLHALTLAGNYAAMLLAKSKSDFPLIKSEYQNVMSKVEYPDPNRHNMARSYADTILEVKTGGSSNDSSNVGGMVIVIAILIILFMSLPVFNLININVSRMVERSSEIGIRKAFGASSVKLVVQFLIENLVVTFIGGALGFLLAIGVSQFFFELLRNLDPLRDVIPGQFSFNWRIFTYSLMVCVFFGLFSGVYPAYKMSRLPIVDALKGGNL